MRNKLPKFPTKPTYTLDDIKKILIDLYMEGRETTAWGLFRYMKYLEEQNE